MSIAPGRVRGRIEQDTAVFLGVPYAAPPFGENRFAAPAPVAPWEGIRDALRYGATAPQPHRQHTLVPEPVIEGEDCLNLNVFTPDPGGAGLPVLVWIHGGGFTAGGNASPWYSGCRFARDGVVVVCINYRLGAEGFLAIEDAPPNRAVRDWIAALRWVQENISAFGGDPSRVTVAGQSAGGVACAALLTCPPARGLFRHAICMSGASMAWAGPERVRALAQALAHELGVPPTRAALASVDPDRVVAVQDAAVARLSRGSEAVRMAFGPVVDGELVLAAPYDSIRRGVPSVRLMVGATGEEFNVTAAATPGGVDEARLERRLGRMGLGPDAIAAYRTSMSGAEPWRVLGQAVTDSTFKAPAIRLADAWAGGGGSVHAYDFDWRTGVGDMGAVHCLDIPFAFDNLDASGVEEVAGAAPPQALADAVHGSWVRFVVDGQPGWEAYEPVRRPAMVFDETCKVVEDPWQLARTAGFSAGRR